MRVGVFFVVFFRLPSTPCISPWWKKRRGAKLREMSERMSDKIEVRENCVKMQRRGGGKDRGKEIILSKPAFISLTVGGGLRFASVRTSRGATFSPSCHFFHPLFSSVSARNAEWPAPTSPPPSRASRHRCIRTTFMTAAALHSRHLLCSKRVSDKAMNTFSGSSLLVSLRSAGHQRWY